MDRPDCFCPPATRRDLLKWCAAGGIGAVLAPLLPARAQDQAGTDELGAVRLPGVVRRRAQFWESAPEQHARCLLCPRECLVAEAERGYCGVRENVGGEYQTLVYGPLCSANVDPIEKKPLFHYLPGSTAFSVATAGCNMECRFCQNWQISQFRPEQVASVEMSPARLAAACRARGAPTIAYTYSEPVVFYEYVHDSAAEARRLGLGSVLISNGYIQEKPLRQLARQLTAVKIDFKAFNDKFYREQCGGELAPVLATLRTLKDLGIWFELVTLVIPTLNDDPGEIGQLARWVLEHLGPDVPLHFTRFHPTYRVTNLPATPVATLERCRNIAREAGIHYVYAGNVPLHAGENTYCHTCRAELIRRVGFRVAANNLRDGHCPQCNTAIPGVWTPAQALAYNPRS